MSVRRSYTVAVVLALGATALCAAQACSTFSAEDDATKTDASTDGPLGVDGEPASDAGAVPDGADGAASLEGCAARYASGDAGLEGGALVFCDDFEGKSKPEEGWTLPSRQGGTLTLATDRVASGTTSLALDCTSASCMVSLATPDLSGVPLPLVVELDLYPDALPTFVDGGNPYNGFVLGSYMSPSSAPRLLYVGVPGVMQMNPYLENPGEGVAKLAADTWYHVVLRYEKNATSLDVTARPVAVTPLHRESFGVDAPTSIRLGIDTGGGPMALHIDDVYIHH